MSNLFSLPRVRSIAGAKLYFRQSETSTPQNTYTDIDLSVAHTNPVVADADGYFDPIYLDPALPNYRVIHTDGSDPDNDPNEEVLLEPIRDDIPSGQRESRDYRLKSDIPELILEETDQTSGNKKWRLRANGNVLTLAPLNDAEDTITGGLSIARNGVLSYNGYTLATRRSEGFSGTLTGYATPVSFDSFTSPDVSLVGNFVCIHISSASSAITGTSNSTDLTMTGIPAFAIPPRATFALCYGLIDNGVTLAGVASISTAGVATFSLMDNPPAAFTNSGTKGLAAGFTMFYPI